MRSSFVFVVLALLSPAARAGDADYDVPAIRAAIVRSIPLLQDGARSFRERSDGRCIACHHQGLVLQTVALARARGFAIDETLARAEMERVHGFYARRRDLYQRALTDPEAAKQADSYGNFTVHVGYWLWGLAAERVPPSDATATTARLLATKQSDDGHWDFEDTARAPMQSSNFTTTALAVFVLKHYGPTDHAETMNRRIARARDWMLANRPRTTDDKAFRLFGLHWAGLGDKELAKATEHLRAGQRGDGGWAQQENMPSDAYATGLALVALHQAGGVAVTDSLYRRGAGSSRPIRTAIMAMTTSSSISVNPRRNRRVNITMTSTSQKRYRRRQDFSAEHLGDSRLGFGQPDIKPLGAAEQTHLTGIVGQFSCLILLLEAADPPENPLSSRRRAGTLRRHSPAATHPRPTFKGGQA